MNNKIDECLNFILQKLKELDINKISFEELGKYVDLILRIRQYEKNLLYGNYGFSNLKLKNI